MASVLTYIIQVNLVLSIIFIGYYLLLKSLTFYAINRAYLCIGAIYAFVYPFIDISSFFSTQTVYNLPVISEYIAIENPTKQSSWFTVSNVSLMILAIGATVLVGRFFIQLGSLLRIHVYSKPAQWKNYWFQNVLFPIVPFSFLNKIYLHSEQHMEVEMDDILKHEDIHVKGWHTLDILLFETIVILCWYNPFVWLLRHAVRQNLEYLTDQMVLNKGINKQQYQYSLLHVSKNGVAMGLGNQFNFKILKKRIAMMNKKRSSKVALSIYVCLLPILIIAGASFTVVKAKDKIDAVVENVQDMPIATLLPAASFKPMAPLDSLDATANLSSIPAPVAVADNRKEVVKSAPERIALYWRSDSNNYAVDTLSKDVNSIKVKGYGVKGVTSGVVVVVDGEEMPINFNLQSLDASRIKHINVVKDASSKDGKGKIYVETNGVVDKNNLTVLLRGANIAEHLGKETVKGETLDVKKPLIILDGKKITDSPKVDPNTIENLTILKDKSAVSVYGEEAKNGVILINSKNNNTLSVQGFSKYSDDDVFFIDGNAVSKNEYTRVTKDKIKEQKMNFKTDQKGKRYEIITRP